MYGLYTESALMAGAWLGHGCGMAAAWLGHGCEMAAAWQGHGSGMAAAWQWHGCGMAVAWQGHGCGMAGAWLRHGCGGAAAYGSSMAAARPWGHKTEQSKGMCLHTSLHTMATHTGLVLQHVAE